MHCCQPILSEFYLTKCFVKWNVPILLDKVGLDEMHRTLQGEGGGTSRTKICTLSVGGVGHTVCKEALVSCACF